MKSDIAKERVTFAALQTRLILFVNNRIQNGDFTERGLARILGISQPQLHNVLKGVRRLQPELADRLMGKFGIDVLDLLRHAELSGRALRSDILPQHLPTLGELSPPAPAGGSLRPIRKPPQKSYEVTLPSCEQAS